jgi:drug/metabolite transporter (DMT)-like permease
MFYLLETVLAPIWVWLIFAETPAPMTLVGGGILVAAIAAHSVWMVRRKSIVQMAG